MLAGIARTTAAVFASMLLAPGPTAAQQSPGARPSLYQRVGGHDVIVAVVDDFLARLDADPELMPFRGDIGAAGDARIRDQLIDFLCAETGGPCLYDGRDMRSVHEGIRVAEAQFQAVVKHFLAALDDQHVGAHEKEEVLLMLAKLRPYVVTR